MRINKAGLALLKKSEGCRLEAYLDARGKPTIGWGHTSDSVALGQRITQHQADEIFKSDLERFEEGVLDLTKGLDLSPNQFSALVCLAFNIGITRFASSTLLKRLRKGDVDGAATQFDRWVLGGDKKLEGLVIRRQREKELFLSP